MNAQIIPFTMDAYDAAFALWQQSEGIGLGDSDSREGTAAYLKRNARLSFVAMDDTRLVGAVICGHDGRRGYLHHLAVHADYRRRSIGRRLVEKCLAALREQGIQKCHLVVLAGNDTGLAFWKSIGWTERTDLTMASRLTAPEGSIA